MHWSSLTGNLTNVLNFSGHIQPTEVKTVFRCFSSFVTENELILALYGQTETPRKSIGGFFTDTD